MQNIFSTLDNLRTISGKAQLAYLDARKNNELRDILEYAYDPHRLYKLDGKLDKFPIGLGEREFDLKSWELFKVILDYLRGKASATDKDVLYAIEFISRFNQQGQDFCRMILAKDLRINMGVKSFQKVWKDFCVEPQVQLANAKGDRADFINGKYSRKFDGKRMYIMDGKPYSRANNLCYEKPVSHLLEQAKELIKDINFDIVLDGECLYFENGIENFQKGISLCQSEERKEGCDNICYVIFDTIGKTNFLTKTLGIPFNEEYDKMIKEFADLSKESPCYSLVPTKMPNIFIARQDTDPSKLMKLRTEHHWEGLMYRNADSPYEYKRTNNLLKIKAMQDMELPLLNMEEGTGKNSGKLGAFVVEYKGTTVNIGSGFSDELREEYWNNKDKYLGKTVKVQYFEETMNSDGTPSLRFPVFLSFRNPDTNEEFLKL